MDRCIRRLAALFLASVVFFGGAISLVFADGRDAAGQSGSATGFGFVRGSSDGFVLPVVSALIGGVKEAVVDDRGLDAHSGADVHVGVSKDVGGSIPQWNVGVPVGVNGREWFRDVRFFLGLRSDVLFGRSSPSDVGYGPYVELDTSFDDVSIGGGGSVLVPFRRSFPFVFSGGGYGRRFDGVWSPGLVGQVFWGSRSFNYHESYGMVGGFVVQCRVGFGASAERAVVLAFHVEGSAFAMPFVLLINAFRGGGD